MLLVGIAPSYQEVASGKPLVGPAGRKVDAAIKWALSVLQRAETDLTVRKTNLVRCRTTQKGKKGLINRDPTKNEIAHCTSRHLIHELSNPRTKVIVPLGELVHGVLCSAKFKQCVGSRIKYGTERIKAHMEHLWQKQKVK
jgi:uracil-DNA glycosylase family 4